MTWYTYSTRASAARRATEQCPILIWERKGNLSVDFLILSWLVVLLVLVNLLKTGQDCSEAG